MISTPDNVKETVSLTLQLEVLYNVLDKQVWILHLLTPVCPKIIMGPLT